MRLLVSCAACNRQYDASGRQPGDRFHCLCGETVTVPEPKAHSAAVVRCSSCGATRHGDESTCRYCGSDFTLHERDLHTICPTCAARVSDTARYCHHCATLLDPAGRPGEPTSRTCPACGSKQRLFSRDFGVEGLSILECERCAGIWLGHAAFRHLVERASAAPANERIHAAAAARVPANSRQVKQQGPMYRPCVECGTLMNRRNYGTSSGVIVDSCRDHGVWFDADELAQILRWIREGGLDHQRRRDAEELEHQRRRTQATPVSGTFDVPPIGVGRAHSASFGLLDILSVAGRLVSLAFD